MADILVLQPIAHKRRRDLRCEARILVFTGAWRERYEQAPEFPRPANKRTRASRPGKAPAKTA